MKKDAFIAIILLWYIALSVFCCNLYIIHYHYIDIFQENAYKVIINLNNSYISSDSLYLSSGNYFPEIFSIALINSFQIAGLGFLIIFGTLLFPKISDIIIFIKRKIPALRRQFAFLFLILFFSPFSSQISVKGDAVIYVKNNSLHSDSIIYENKETFRTQSEEEKISGTIYIVQGTHIYNLKENTNLKLEYIGKENQPQPKYQHSNNETQKKSLAKKTADIPKAAYKKKSSFFYNPFSDSDLIPNISGRKVVAVLLPIQVKNTIGGITGKNNIPAFDSGWKTVPEIFSYKNFISSFLLNSFHTRPPPVLIT